MDTPAIEAHDLRKTFRTASGIERCALAGFSLTVPRGACFGLVGPAGSGKTTFAAVAAAGMRANSGRIRVFGEPPAATRVRLFPAAQSCRRLLDFLNRATAGRLPATTSSGGWLARALELARTPAAPPDLLILDDVGGLDHSALADAHRSIRLLADRGLTILVCSRSATQIARLCDRAAIVRAGRVVAFGSAAELLGARGFRLTVMHLSDDLQETLTRDGLTIGFNGDCYWIESRDRAKLGGTIDRIRLAGGNIEGLEELSAF
jgi:ABC-2 type transport system ATP-binding protein